MIQGEYLLINYASAILYIPSEMKEPQIADLIGEAFQCYIDLDIRSVKILNINLGEIQQPEEPSDIFTAALVTRKLIK